MVHTIEVLAITPAFQCQMKSFTVTPYWACPYDTFQPVLWDINSLSTIPVYEHVISVDADTFTYSQPINTEILSCPTLYYFLQQETSPGVWTDYAGPLVSFDPVTREVFVSTTIADVGLDLQTLNFRLAVASVDTLSVAVSPAYWDFSVNFVHPCNYAVFSEHAGVSSPIVAEVEDAPHPSPIFEIAPDFPYDLQGTFDCGP